MGGGHPDQRTELNADEISSTEPVGKIVNKNIVHRLISQRKKNFC